MAPEVCSGRSNRPARRDALRTGEEEADLVPAGYLATVGAGEAGVDLPAAECATHLGHLRAAVDLRAGDVPGHGREGLVDRGEPFAGACRVGQRSAWRTVERPQLRRCLGAAQ